MPQPSDNLALHLRAAVLANDHEKATRLCEQYTDALRTDWMLLSREERKSSSLPKKSLELLHWAREMTIMQQALATQHLAVVEKASRYQMARAVYLGSAGLGAQR